jgi:hypothetical protein
MPGVPDDAAGFRAANARLRELLAERDERIAEQDAVIAVLREQLAGVQSQVADLAARVASNSRNSSKPPSSDGLAKPAPKSLREKTGRKPGRPKGQPGATMELSDNPVKRVRHRPAKCGCCGKSLKNAPVTAAGSQRPRRFRASVPSSARPWADSRRDVGCSPRSVHASGSVICPLTPPEHTKTVSAPRFLE